MGQHQAQKGAADAKRGQIFTKVSKELTVAARIGGSDEGSNPRLKAAILKARAANMPKDNIEKAIKKGTGELEGMTYEELVYEGFATDGIAIIVEVMTDKKSRTLPELKNLISKGGGNLAENGSVSYLFEHKGLILVKADNLDENALLDITLEAGADDFSPEEDHIFAIKTSMENFHSVLNKLTSLIENKGGKILESGLKYIPINTIELPEERAKMVLRLIDNIENHDDVQNVYCNLELGDWAGDE